MLKAIWSYRGFIGGSVRREFQTKYRNSLLGATWTILSPLSMIIVYTVVFSQVMGTRMSGLASPFAYGIYLCAGTLTWALFAEITSRSQSVFIEHANLIKKLQFPRLCLPVIVVLNALVNFGIVFGLFMGFLAVSGNFPGWLFFAMIPVLLLQILFSIGLGMILGVLNVFFRDVGQFFTILLQFWFWFTPIVYPVTALPESARALLVFNPMMAPIGAYQQIFVYQQMPDWSTLLPFGMLGVFFCILGIKLFRKRAGEMVDEL